MVGMWSGWISTSLIVTAIWFATWIAGGVDQVPYFWPIWVIGPWGAILLASTIGGVTQGQPRAEAERRAAASRQRREADRQERRDRRERGRQLDISPGSGAVAYDTPDRGGRVCPIDARDAYTG